MLFVIVGPGALGSLLAARISLSLGEQRTAWADSEEQELILLDYREERASRLRETGLVLEEKGHSRLCTVRVETDPSLCTECSVLFLCVKATAAPGALAEIAPFISPDTMLVAMQNGIGHLDAVAAFPCITALGITSEGATLVAPGHVRHGGAGTTRIGLLDAETVVSAGRLAATVTLLNRAGFVVSATSEPLKYAWAKLFVNVAINALTAIQRCPNGELLNSQATRDVMEKAVGEALAVAKALDIAVEGDPVATAFKVCELTANNISSMHQDVRNKRRTEIDAINGAIVARGKLLGIPTPVNEDLVRQIKHIEEAYLH